MMSLNSVFKGNTANDVEGLFQAEKPGNFGFAVVKRRWV